MQNVICSQSIQKNISVSVSVVGMRKQNPIFFRKANVNVRDVKRKAVILSPET